MRTTLLLLLGMIALGGCVTRDAMYQKLAKRAAFDLDCPAHKLTITELDASNAGVSGCGRHAMYIGICQNLQCTWIQEGGRAATRSGDE